MVHFNIVTINWNNLEGLKKTYQSVVRQSYRNFKWIVVDGASNDGGAEWLNMINDPQADITSEPDNGLYHAMNKGLEKGAATPGFTLFLNSGDCLYDESVLAKVARHIEQAETRPKYVYGDYYLQSGSGKLTKAFSKSIDRLFIGMPSSHQAMYFENEHLRSVRFREDYKLSADYCMIIEFVNGLDGSEIMQLKEPLCIFDITGVSEMRRFAAIKEDVQIRRRYLKLSSFKNYVLYGLHYVHAHIKWIKAAVDKRAV
ncbi:MAG TPA: glycosyltransferase [Pseudomonas xinjiangensis]|uniref:Glycosyltransferase n=2 Tax=root TaxID=1 RepID=A0A7V1BR99_9GAMM|nr:glycosyltransferase [Halopseudomonas xinjiangensis]HEC47899.1 glycosyltransferase [Halopseudomonas xinjiangensis]